MPDLMKHLHLKFHFVLPAVLLLLSYAACNTPQSGDTESVLAKAEQKRQTFINHLFDRRETLQTMRLKGKIKLVVTSYDFFNPFGWYEQPGDAHPCNDTMLFNERGYLIEKIKHGRFLQEYHKEVIQYDDNDNDTTSYSTFYQRAEPMPMGEPQKAGYYTYKTINDPNEHDAMQYNEKTRILGYTHYYSLGDTAYDMFYSFDMNGNVIANWAYDEDNRLAYITYLQTDVKGRDIAQIISPAEGTFRISFLKEYDNRDNLLKEMRYAEDGRLLCTIYNKYDAHNNVIASSTVNDSNKYTRRDYYQYEYDAMGNPTSITSLEGNGFRMVVVSRVEYYYEYYPGK